MKDLNKIYESYFKKENVNILDIGTGFYNNLRLLLKDLSMKATIYSIDPNSRIIEKAARRFRRHVEEGRLKLYIAKAEKLPFPDEYFQYVTVVTTMHHIKNKEKAFKEIARVMRKDGIAIIVDWTSQGWIYTPHSAKELEKNMYEVKKLASTYFNILEELNKDEFYIIVLSRK